jgi:ParB/RepB/Spo0J family partition protein
MSALVNMADIFPDEDFNCRGHFNKMEVSDLAKDIEQKTSLMPDKLGLIEPIILRVHEASEIAKSGGKPYGLVAGFRRYFAFVVLKRDKIPAEILHGITQAQAAIINLSENVQRKDLNILQEAMALKKLHEMRIPRDSVAKELGVSSGWVQTRYNLLELPEEIQHEAASGIINQKQIKEIWSLKNTDKQFEAVRKLKDAKARGDKGEIKIKEKKEVDPTAPKLRSRTHIFEMMSHISGILGHGFHTRGMAWAAGELSTFDLLKELKEQAVVKGVSYTIPQTGTIFNGE